MITTGHKVRPRLMRLMNEGKSLVYVSEAGTPLVADPGYALGQAAIDAGLQVIGAPGPSAVIAALTVAGLPTDRFFFAGFAPNAKAARQRFFEEFAEGARNIGVLRITQAHSRDVSRFGANLGR